MYKFLSYLKYNKTLLSLSEILVFVFTLLAVFYRHAIYDYSLIFYFCLVVLLGTVCTLCIYIRIYYWRKLHLSFISFVLFYLNIIQMLIYIIAISIFFELLYNENTAPIYLGDLSIFSQYRYLVLTSISILMLLGFIIIKIFGYKIPNVVIFPYLKDEIHKILYTWNHTFMGDICIKLIDLLYLSLWFRTLFFITHFCFFYVIRLLSIGLLFYCVFFQGDFRIFIYITPFMFIVWLLSFFNHYFFIFLKGCENYICTLVSATLINKGPSIFGFIKLDSTSKVLFTLTEEAISKGYTKIDIDHLAKEWYIQTALASYFSVYLKLINYLNYFILSLQIFIWSYITQLFFFPLVKKGDISLSFLLWCNRTVALGKLASRTYVTEARRVLSAYQKDLSIVTEGAHTGNHPALIDPAVRNPDDPREVLYEGQLTHGKGSVENPSYPLHATKDLQGNNKAQNFVPTVRPTFTKEYYYDSTAIPGSQTFLDDPQVKVNLAKYTPRAEET